MYQLTRDELTKAREQNILSDSAYAYFSLRLSKPTTSETQAIIQDTSGAYQLPATLLFTQLGKLQSKELVKAQLNSFTVHWRNPAALPNLSRMRCREMEAQGLFQQTGYLYHALAAENPSKTSPQEVSTSNLQTFYNLSTSAIFAEMSKLIERGLATIELGQAAVEWQPQTEVSDFTQRQSTGTPASYQLSQSEVNLLKSKGILTDLGYGYLTILLKLADFDTSQFAPLEHNHGISAIAGLNEALNQLAAEIASKQPAGNYIWETDARLSDKRLPWNHTHERAEINQLDTQLQQITGLINNRVTHLELGEEITRLQAAISEKQPTGDYALNNSLTNAIALLQEAINEKQRRGDYALNDSLTSAIATLQNAISLKQPAGDYIDQETLDEAMRDAPTKKTVLPENPWSNDIWEQTSGDAQSFYRWFWDGGSWRGTTLYSREFSFNAVTTNNFWECMNKNREANAYHLDEFFLTIKTAAANSTTKYHTINLTVRDQDGSNSGIIRSYNTKSLGANIWHSERIVIHESQSITRLLSIEVLATNAPGNISGSAGFSYRWLMFP